MLADRGMSIVWSKRLDAETVSVEIEGRPLDEALVAVARRMGAEAVLVGETWYVGEAGPEDTVALVRRIRVRDETVPSIRETLQSFVTGRGSVSVTPDGVLMVTEKPGVIGRIDQYVRDLERSGRRPVWCVQLYVIGLDRSSAEDLGIDAAPAVELAAGLGAVSAGGGPIAIAESATASASLTAALRAVRSRSDATLYLDPAFTLADGETGTYRRGRSIPTRTSDVDRNGNIRETGNARTQTGDLVEAVVDETSAETAELSYTLSMTEDVGESEGLPVLAETRLAGTLEVTDGGVYLLSAVRSRRRVSLIEGLLRYGRADSSEETVIAVFARVQRVGTPTLINTAELSGTADATVRSEVVDE